MSDSELSSVLSSPPSSDHEMAQPTPPTKSTKKSSSKKNGTMLSFVESSPPRKKRAPSPAHEEVLSDNPDIAFIVMFRSRFSDVFPTKLQNLGPQDIERGVVDPLPSPQVESLLCALLGLVLNRKKYVERGHYGRALEEAVQTQKSQWPRAWNGINPLHGGRTFNTMSPEDRLTLLKTLVLWSLHESEAVNGMIKESYKQARHDGDENQPLSVQPWGRDGDKRRYWLVEGRDDTAFRVYRESNPVLKHNTWWSVAGTIDELRVLSDKLKDEDGTQAARRLSERIINAIPRFEATDEKRKRREYRMNRKAQFSRPEPGFSLYEGRTRGKRMRYTFSDEEDEDTSDAGSARRSTRQSGRGTPAAPSGPTVTASGRHVRSRLGGVYGESLLSGQTTTERASPATGEYERSDASEEPHPAHGRSTRAAANAKPANGRSKIRKHIEGYNSIDEIDDEDDASSSGGEWDGGDEEDEVDRMDVDEEDDTASSEEDIEDDAEPKPRSSLIVKLRYRNASKSLEVKPAQPLQDSIAVQPRTASTPPKVEPIPNGVAGSIQVTRQPVQAAPQAAPPVVANGVAVHHAPDATPPQPAQPATVLPPFSVPADAPLKQYPQVMNVPITSHEPSQAFQTTILPPNPTTAYGWQ
ncbi:hypothetical protein BU16DRAFT_531020 [Lophium mytilinum]|uniref:WHIM1 domain-containing protein n=1 Tax=Lophium mytilinum TaxID=390894 RepID=A0A6A6QFY4_9PEZI|nr:hypothetical protein BU16DRAFT_531020 [Lophium mytilinum]